MTDNSIFIPGNITSSKNSQNIYKAKNHYFISSSTQTKSYIKSTDTLWKIYANKYLRMTENIGLPHVVCFQFIRRTKQKFDIVNMAQLPLDLMQKNGWIIDDDYKNIIPVFHPEILIDKENYGIRITPITDLSTLYNIMSKYKHFIKIKSNHNEKQ